MTISNLKASPGIKVKKAVATVSFAALLALPAFALPALAADIPPAGGGTIEAFVGSNLVNVQGYPAGEQVTIEVLRKDVLVGKVSGTTDADGFIEFNHAGGGQVSEGGDCFEPPATPDIVAGDVIQTKNVAGEITGSATVRDIGVNFGAIKTNTVNNTITVSGHARNTANARIAQGDVLELRLNKGSANNWDSNDRRDLRVDVGRNLDANGNFTRVLRVAHNDAVDWKNNPGEVGLEWSAAAPAGDEEVNPPSIFVADEAGGEAIVGCPPLAEYGIKKSSVKAINKAFVAGNADLVLSGVSFDASAVNVTLNGVAADSVALSSPDGIQRWTARFSNAKVGAMRNGMLTARATYAVETATFNGANLKILKDTVAPRGTAKATPQPGVYNRAISVRLSSPAGTEVHYTVNGSRPTARSREFVKPIRVTGTQTIKAVVVDRAGNVGPAKAYRYVIR